MLILKIELLVYLIGVSYHCTDIGIKCGLRHHVGVQTKPITVLLATIAALIWPAISLVNAATYVTVTWLKWRSRAKDAAL